MHSLHMKNFDKHFGLDTLSRCSPAFPFPSAQWLEPPPTQRQKISLEEFFSFSEPTA